LYVVVTDRAEAELLEWVRALTGLDPSRAADARGRLRAANIPHVTEELVDRFDVDSAVASLYLAECIELLVAADVPRAKIRAKLRNDPEVWPTWAELRAAEAVLRTAEDAVGIALEPDRRRGVRSADFELLADDGGSVAVEFKALGLSDEEASFFQRMTPVLRSMRPRRGIAVVHTPIGSHPVQLSRAQRRHGDREAEALAANLPQNMRDLSASVAVAHATEAMYLARFREHVTEAIGQLPEEKPAWLAFHWSNGAPASVIRRALSEIAVPSNVVGAVLLGAVVLTPGYEIHNFAIAQYAPFTPEGEMGGLSPGPGNIAFARRRANRGHAALLHLPEVREPDPFDGHRDRDWRSATSDLSLVCGRRASALRGVDHRRRRPNVGFDERSLRRRVSGR
jgi:hypothetical protein